MNSGTTDWITVLLRLPVFYNAHIAGYRAPVENGKFLDTADELARRFGGARSPSSAMTLREGSGGTRALSTQTCWVLIEVDVPDTTESRDWLRAYARDVLLERFRQKAIYLKSVGPVEHLIVSEEEIGDED